MRFVADVGNSRVKVAEVTAGGLANFAAGPAESVCVGAGEWLIAGVNPAGVADLMRRVTDVGGTAKTVADFRDLPLVVNVPMPEKVGIDRLLGCVAANRLRRPGVPAFTVDAGTAVTVNLLDGAGTFLGGTIAPGVGTMRAALHHFTAKLPRVPDDVLADAPGADTAAAIAAGTLAFAVGGVDRIVRTTAAAMQFAEYDLFVTGGGGEAIAAALGARYRPHLVLEGLAAGLRTGRSAT